MIVEDHFFKIVIEGVAAVQRSQNQTIELGFPENHLLQCTLLLFRNFYSFVLGLVI